MYTLQATTPMLLSREQTVMSCFHRDWVSHCRCESGYCKGVSVMDGQDVKLEVYLGSDYKVVFCDHVVSNVRNTATSVGGLPLRFFLYPAILFYFVSFMNRLQTYCLIYFIVSPAGAGHECTHIRLCLHLVYHP